MSAPDLRGAPGTSDNPAIPGSKPGVVAATNPAPASPAIDFDDRIVGSFVRTISSPAAFAVDGESCGLLLGHCLSAHPLHVAVDGFHPMAADRARGGAPHFLQEQQEALDEIMRTHKHRVVGMYRTCRTGLLGLTPEDREVFCRYYNNSQFVYLLLRPRSLARTIGVLYEPHSAVGDRGTPVEIIVPGDAPSPPAVPNGWRIRRTWQVVAIAAGLFIPGVWISRSTVAGTTHERMREEDSREPARVQLEILRAGGQLLISWKPLSAAGLELVSGRLSISDSGSKREVLLDRVELASGRMLYEPLTNDVSVTIQATTGDNRLVTDSLRAVYAAMVPPKPITTLLQPSSIGRRGTPAQTVFEVRAQVPAEQRPARAEIPEEHGAGPATKRLAVPGTPRPAPAEISLPEPPDMKPDLLALNGSSFAPVMPHRTPEWQMPTHSEPSPALALLSPQVVPASAISTVQPVLAPTIRRYINRPIVIRVVASLDANGRVVFTSASPANTIWESQMAEAARAAVTMWRFKPATVDGRQVPGEVTINFRFAP